jgi:hypothetical protein
LDREDIFVDWLENGGDYLNRTAVAKLLSPVAIYLSKWKKSMKPWSAAMMSPTCQKESRLGIVERSD